MAVKRTLVHLSLEQNEIQNVSLQNIGADPTSPISGQIWFLTTTNRPIVRSAGINEPLAFLSDIVTGHFTVSLDDSDPNVTRVFASGETTYTITHGLASLDIVAQVKDIATNTEVAVLIRAISATQCEVVFNGNSTNNTFKVVIIT